MMHLADEYAKRRSMIKQWLINKKMNHYPHCKESYIEILFYNFKARIKKWLKK